MRKPPFHDFHYRSRQRLFTAFLASATSLLGLGLIFALTTGFLGSTSTKTDPLYSQAAFLTPTLAPYPTVKISIAPTFLTPKPIYNLINNPGFELADSIGHPSNWTVYKTFMRGGSSPGKYYGLHYTMGESYSVSQIVRGVTGGRSYTFGGIVNIPPNVTYPVSSPFSFKIVINWRDSSNYILRSDTLANFRSVTSGWQKVNRTVSSIPARTTNARLVMHVVGPVIIYIDNFSLR